MCFPACLRRQARPLRYTWTRDGILPAPSVEVIPCTHDDGEVRVVPPDDAQPPVRAFWRGNVARTSGDTLRATGLEAGAVSVHIQDARGRTSGATTVQVESTLVPTVVGYESTDASMDCMHDGRVVARCKNAEGVSRVMWSNGAQTNGLALRNCLPGTYVAMVVEVNGRACRCLHACPPAVVDVEPGERV